MSTTMAFEADSMTFADVAVTDLRVDAKKRTIEGLALPYGKIGVRGGRRFKFAPQSLRWDEDVSRVKLLKEHQQAIGKAIELSDDGDGLRVRFAVARGKVGDQALMLAEDGVLDGFSVGVDFEADDIGPDPVNRGTTLIRRADLREISLTALPSFQDARVTSVAASRTGDVESIVFSDQEEGAGPDGPTRVSPLRAQDRPTQDDGLAPPLMPARELTAAMLRFAQEGRSVRFTTDDPKALEQFATVTTSLTGVPAVTLNRSVLEPRRLATTARLPVTDVPGVAPANFPVFGAGSAEITAENVAKQEYAAVTLASSTPQMINAWTDFTRQVQLSTPAFEQRLRSKLAALVAIREDKLLIATALALTLPTFAKTAGVARSDALLQAAATVVGAVGAQPNVAVVNTADVPGIFTGSVGAGGEFPEEELRLAVRGMTVYPSADIATGTALVGAWPAGASLVKGLPPTYLVDAVSGIKTNKITVLLEEAVALAVDDLSAFVKITTFTS
jgi:HK97 family phage prohead protease